MSFKLRKTKYVFLMLTKIDIQRPEVEVASKHYRPLNTKLSGKKKVIRTVGPLSHRQDVQ